MKRGLYKLSKTLDERFWIKVIKTETCWNWTGSKIRGYGHIGIGRRSGGNVLAHRYSYEQVHGTIPEGLVIDHLCRNPSCVRPDHLEAVTLQENLRRGLHGPGKPQEWCRKEFCIRGHSFAVHGFRQSNGKGNGCKECNLIRQREYRAARRAA